MYVYSGNVCPVHSLRSEEWLSLDRNNLLQRREIPLGCRGLKVSTILYIVILDCTSQFNPIQYVAQHCTALHCFMMYYTALHSFSKLCTAPHLTALPYTTLQCTALLECTSHFHNPTEPDWGGFSVHRIRWNANTNWGQPLVTSVGRKYPKIKLGFSPIQKV